jgi:hypothetical protein
MFSELWVVGAKVMEKKVCSVIQSLEPIDVILSELEVLHEDLEEVKGYIRAAMVNKGSHYEVHSLHISALRIFLIERLQHTLQLL